MEEDGHLVPLGLGFEGLPTVSILRMVRASLDRGWLLSAVVATNGHSECTRISALVTPSLTFGLASGRFAGEDIG